MVNNIAKCGCDCFNCPTYKENIATPESRKECSAGWEKYLDIKLSPEKLRECDGCSIPETERKTYYLNCKVRRCAIVNGIENCAFCTGFPCEELINIHSLQAIRNREEFIDRSGKLVPEEDYMRFIEPYAGIGHLTKIRGSLTMEDLKDFKKYTSQKRSIPFENKSNQPEEVQIIHTLLTTLFTGQNISFANLQTLKKKREILIKILWTTGRYGKFSEEGALEVGSKIFLSQKIGGIIQTLQAYLNELTKYDIHCEIIPLIEKGWITSSGGLRKEGWKFTLRFGDSLHGVDTLRMLKLYILTLIKYSGDKAFRLFAKADMTMLATH